MEHFSAKSRILQVGKINLKINQLSMPKQSSLSNVKFWTKSSSNECQEPTIYIYIEDQDWIPGKKHSILKIEFKFEHVSAKSRILQVGKINLKIKTR